MSSQRSREEQRHLSIATLAIASIASATAALITSQFWQGGTPIAAAVTPVIVALVSEMLHRPTAKIAGRITSERAALPPDAADPTPAEARRTDAARAPRRRAADGGDERLPQPARSRARVSWRIAAITAALAFVIAAAALTLPELIAGQSLGNSDRNTSIFGGKKQAGAVTDEEPTPADESAPDTTQRETTEETDTTETEPTTDDEPAEPQTTDEAPQPKKAPTETAPAPAPSQAPPDR